MDGAGLIEIRWLLFAGGIIAIHSGCARQAANAAPAVAAARDGGDGGGRRLAAAQDGRGRVAPGRAGARSRRGPRRDAVSTLDAGGKRLRSIGAALRGPESGPAATRAATAIELAHMATLVHDDVLDAAASPRAADRVLGVGAGTGDGARRSAVRRAFAELAGPDSSETTTRSRLGAAGWPASARLR